MAEADAAAEHGAHAAGKGFDALKQKVGPLPLYVWVIAAVGIWWYFQRKNTGKAGSTGQQTDPAGNVGNIDPSTGYVYGSPEDLAGLAQNSSQSSGGPSGSGSTTGGQYPDNNAWGRAAVEYLVGLGIDPTQANQAIQQYLASQNLTSSQQADVNLAIQALGPPPQLPGPTSGNPPPGPPPPPPPGTVYATNPPTGLVARAENPHTVALKWNRSSNAKSYTIRWGVTAAMEGSKTVTQPSDTIGTLKAGTRYNFTVQAEPAKKGAGMAHATATTPREVQTHQRRPGPVPTTEIPGGPNRPVPPDTHTPSATPKSAA